MNRQSDTNQLRPFPTLTIHLILVAFALGGLVALLIMNGLLNRLLDLYAPINMDAASTVLDLSDKLLPYLFTSGGLLLLLLLVTALAWARWIRKRSESGLLRYSVALMAVAIMLTAGGLWVRQARGQLTAQPPMTPTPAAQPSN